MGWGDRVEPESLGTAWKWQHVPKTGRLVFRVLTEGWLWYDAHYIRPGYVRCVKGNCPWCERGSRPQKRMIIGGRALGRRGRWGLELPEGAGLLVQEIWDLRGGIRGVTLTIRKEGQYGKGETRIDEESPGSERDPEWVDGKELVSWVEKQDFWKGWQSPDESEKT